MALVILALGMMAVQRGLNDYALGSTYLEQKTLASWIATNKLTELAVAPQWPAVGDYEEDVEFANRQWRCEIVVAETDVDNLHRVDVSVRLQSAPEREIHKVSALIEPPAPAGFMPPQWSAPQRSGDAEGGRG